MKLLGIASQNNSAKPVSRSSIKYQERDPAIYAIVMREKLFSYLLKGEAE